MDRVLPFGRIRDFATLTGRQRGKFLLHQTQTHTKGTTTETVGTGYNPSRSSTTTTTAAEKFRKLTKTKLKEQLLPTRRK
jgi:hypothetical protein